MSFRQRFWKPSRHVPRNRRDLAEQMQVLLLGMVATALLTYAVLARTSGSWLGPWYLLAAAGALLACLALVRLGRVALASALLLAGCYAMVLWFQLSRGPGTRLSYLALVFVAIAWLLGGARGGLGFASLVTVTTLILVGRRVAEGGRLSADLMADVGGFLITLAGLSAVLWLFARMLGRAYGRVIEQERVSREYSLAQQIQQRLLPTALPQPEHGHLRALCEPAQEISGDFYDVIRLSKGRLGLVVGDVCGKGLPAALLMNLSRTTLRAEAQHSASPAVTLSRVSAALAEGLGRSQFIALSYAMYDPRSLRLRLSNAGQLEPILVRGGQVRYLQTPGERLPLGLGVERRYDELMVQLQPGDRVLFYTDGLLEAQSGGELFGFERFEAILRRINSGASAIDRLRRELERFTGGARAADDVTLLELDLSVSQR